jgi:hypothetical protein
MFSAGLDSIPASVRVHIEDRNDNGPKLQLSKAEIKIFNGQLVYPVIVMV